MSYRIGASTARPGACYRRIALELCYLFATVNESSILDSYQVIDMTEEFKKTVKIVRPPKVHTDERGRTVWSDTVETATLELVSTQMLKKIIDSDDADRQGRLREAAKGKEGLLAHNSENDRFEIITDDELKQILDDSSEVSEASKMFDKVEESPTVLIQENEELELVSTQFLRKILNPDDDGADDTDGSAGGGFNPYDSA